jgi:hypothetical protein
MPIAAAKNHELHFRLRLLVAELDSFEYFVDHCLKRPRFLINIIENAIVGRPVKLPIAPCVVGHLKMR